MFKKIKAASFTLLFLSVIFLSGCSTVKGLGVGVGATAQGVAEDCKGLWDGVIKLDKWMTKNMW